MQATKQGKARSTKLRAAASFHRGASAQDSVDPRKIQLAWGMNTYAFSRLTGFSPRKVADMKAGAPLTASTKQRLAEVDRLRAELSKVVKADALAKWMDTPNDSFGGLKPLEVVERGEIDRLWRMCYRLTAGEPG